MREQFVSTLTHDLQTPLTTLKLTVQLLLKSPGPELINENGERLINNISRIEFMIRDLLDANRIRAGKSLPIQIDRMDITNCVKQTIQELTSQHGSRFSLNSPPILIGYWCEEAIRRITENLCTNAVKYGSENTPINITILELGDQVELRIQNEGNPIPQEEQQLLFNPFERAKAVSKSDKKGWGLGLTLVKGLTEAMRGNVYVSSDHKHGTIFSVVLPRDCRVNTTNANPLDRH